MTAAEIIAALHRQEKDSVAYWSAFDQTAFFEKIGTGWSPADTVRHLNKATRAVAKGLRYPKLLLRLLFGAARRPSRSLEELTDTYRRKLAEGGRAGRFAPSDRSENDFAAWRTSIMSDFSGGHHELTANIARWSESALDRLQMPHPILGKLTVREMLLFTLYHQQHHIDAIKRRLAERH